MAPYITAFALTRSIGNCKPKSSESVRASWSNRPYCLRIPPTLQGSSLVFTSELVSIPQPQSPGKPFYSKDSPGFARQTGSCQRPPQQQCADHHNSCCLQQPDPTYFPGPEHSAYLSQVSHPRNVSTCSTF